MNSSALLKSKTHFLKRRRPHANFETSPPGFCSRFHSFSSETLKATTALMANFGVCFFLGGERGGLVVKYSLGTGGRGFHSKSILNQKEILIKRCFNIALLLPIAHYSRHLVHGFHERTISSGESSFIFLFFSVLLMEGF